MLKEFKEFAMKGNVVDLAVGVIIGAAFGGIVTSLVGDIIMPIIGAITGGLDFSNYFTGPVEDGDRHQPGRRQKAGRRAGLGQFPHADDQLHDRRLRAVPRDPRHEPVEAQGRGRARAAEADQARSSC